MSSPRVYRYLPFQVSMTVGVAFAGVLRQVVLGVQPVLTVLFWIALAVLLALVWRIRTVIDETGVTEHGMLRTARVVFHEIDDIDTVADRQGWTLRLRCPDGDTDVVRCRYPLGPGLGRLTGRPRMLAAAAADIRRAAGFPA